MTHDNRDPNDPNDRSAFSYFDVVETSYHFWAHKIDLHLSDDPGGSLFYFLKKLLYLSVLTMAFLTLYLGFNYFSFNAISV